MQFKLVPLRTSLVGGGGERTQSTPSPDLPATFGRANTCFPNWSLTAPIVIFWLTLWSS